MLVEIDRLQLAVPEAEPVIAIWQKLLGAEIESSDKISCLGAARTCLRLGKGFIEILTADGPGLVAEAVEKRGGHMFSAGASSLDVHQVAEKLAVITTKNGAPEAILEQGQLYIDGASIGIPGLRLVVSKHAELSSVGAIDYMYEATLLAANSEQQTARFAEVFELDAKAFANIDSPTFGYNGTLTLFKPRELHRFEVISPYDVEKTMGRFLEKMGPILYMGFAETDQMLDIETRARDMGVGITVDRPEGRGQATQADQMWLHPKTLGGVMLGLSRPSMAWQWSGDPGRVTKI